MASASPMFCEAPVTTARASGLGAGTAMRRTISWATMDDPRPPGAAQRSHVLTSAMSLIRDDYHYLWPGLALLACAAACTELATVPYNAMLRQLSTPQNSGRVS